MPTAFTQGKKAQCFQRVDGLACGLLRGACVLIERARLVACFTVLLGTGAPLHAQTGALPNNQIPPPLTPAPGLLNAGAPIPSNGGLIITSASGAATVVQLTPAAPPNTPPAAPIAGTLTQLGALWIWRADEPIAPGSYELVLSHGEVAGVSVGNWSSYGVGVIEAWQPELPELTSVSSARVHDMTTARTCCRRFDGRALVDSHVCAPTRARSSVLVSTSLETAAPLEQRDQFLYRARATTTPSDATMPAFYLASVGSAVRFDEQAEEYCVAIDAIDIVSQEIHADVVAEPSCVAHDALPVLGEHDVEVQDAALTASTCTAPPVGFEARWCALNEEHCTTYPTSCPLFEHICHGGPLPDSPLGGASGTSGIGSGGMGGSAGYPPVHRDPNRRVDGCQVAPFASAKLGAGAWLMLALWLERRMRRRREH